MAVEKRWMFVLATVLLVTPATAAPRSDADGNGTLSLVEFQAAQKQRLLRADNNGDGKLSLDELKARPEAGKSKADPVKTFQRNDADGDRVINQAEIDLLTKRRFDRLDRDAEGAVSQQEIAAQRAKATD